MVDHINVDHGSLLIYTGQVDDGLELWLALAKKKGHRASTALLICQAALEMLRQGTIEPSHTLLVEIARLLEAHQAGAKSHEINGLNELGGQIRGGSNLSPDETHRNRID